MRLIGFRGILMCFSFFLFSMSTLTADCSESMRDLVALDLASLLDMEVTVATRVPVQYREVPAAISIITAEDIANSGYSDIWDLLRSQSGVNVFQLGGNFVGVSIRGFNDKYSNKIQVLQDGRSIFNPTTQGVYWADQSIILEDIERIEIMRGPNSVLYGFNAFNGVINIVSKDPADTKGALSKITFGTDSFQEFTQRFGDSIGKLDYRITYSRDNQRGLGDDDGRAYDDFRRLNSLNLNTKYKISDEKSIDFIAGGKIGNRGRQPISDESSYIEENHQVIRYNESISDDSSFTVLASRTYWNENYTSIANKNAVQYIQHDFEFQHSFKPFESHTVVWGANFRRNDAKHNLFIDKGNYYHDTILRVFLQDAIELNEKTTYYSGLEWEENKYTGSDWSLRQTIMYNLFEDHFLRATFGRAYHAHSFLEYYFNIPFAVTGNINLERESISAYELGYRGSLLDKTLLFDLELFYNNINKIRVTTANPAATFNNANRAEVKGLEFDIKYLPYAWLKTYSNYAYLSVDDKIANYKNQDPRHSFNLGFTVTMDKRWLPSYIDTKFGYVGSIKAKEISEPNTAKKKVSDYVKLDIKVAKKFCNDSLEVALVGLNLWDDDHYEFATNSTSREDAQVSRQFFITIKKEF